MPLAHLMYAATGRDDLKYVVIIAAGATAMYALVPLKPGPLVIAEILNINLGTLVLIGA